MKHVTIIATSLNEDSKSQILSRTAEERLLSSGISCDHFDLRQLQLPMSGPAESWGTDDANKITQSVKRSSHVLFAVPIYCYDVNAAAKNVIELIGKALTGKVIGFICSAGGANSYMSVMSFANHMMLDFRSIIVPRFLYVQDQDWKEDGSLDDATDQRLDLLIHDMSMIHVDENTDVET